MQLFRSSRTRARALALITAVASLAAIPATSSATELFYASTPANKIVSFTSQAPSQILSSRSVVGLATSETIVGMDVRPATNQLYALTSAGRLLVVNPVSGAIKVIGAPIAINGTSFGFDFNPIADRIRIVSDTDQNLRVNPDDATVTADTTLAYKAGDAGAGANPKVTGIAYTNSTFGGATPAATVLYGIDTDRNTFVQIDPPNAGTITTNTSFGIDLASHAQLDVASNGAIYAVLSKQGTSTSQLYLIAAGAGVATEFGTPTFGNLGVPSITALASTGLTADDDAAPLVAVGNYTVFRNVWLKTGLRFTTACNEACTVVTTLRIGTTVAGSATVSMNAAGTRAPRIQLNADGKRLAASSADLNATLTFDNVDLAGNKRTQVTKFRSERSR